MDDACKQQINEAVNIGADLLAKMHTDGVAHVIWMGFFYIGGLEEAVDYGFEAVKTACEAAEIHCEVADLRDLEIPRGFDGVHPTEEGYKMLAQRIWDVKLDNKIPV